MKLISMLGAGQIFPTNNLGEYGYLKSTIDFLNSIIIPATVVLVLCTAILIICLAFCIIKAESGDKANEMKKRMIGAMIAIVVITIAIWLLGWMLSSFSQIMSTLRGAFGNFGG